MKTPPPSGASHDVREILLRLGFPSDTPHRPVVRSAAGVLVTIPIPAADGPIAWRGVLLDGRTVERVGPPPAHHHFSAAHGLEGASADMADTLSEAAWAYLERIEELDAKLADLQSLTGTGPLRTVWTIGRKAAKVRADIGRALVAVAELAREHDAELPGLAEALPGVTSELERTEGLARSVEDSVNSLILLRNADDANVLAATANELGRTSNRIAELQNISNIRMLGITYLALIIAVIGAVVLIPNTGATILGMPSAGWVPGYWVALIMFGLALIPFALVFSRPWIRELLGGMGRYEFRVSEGMAHLPERIDASGRPTPDPPR
jgi:hypothetical protein